MGYSLGEWFNEVVHPKLKKYLEKIDSGEDVDKENYQVFIESLKEVFSYKNSPFYPSQMTSREEDFGSLLLRVILDDQGELYKMLNNCFDRLTRYEEGKELEKLVYTDCGTRITCDFNIYDTVINKD